MRKIGVVCGLLLFFWGAFPTCSFAAAQEIREDGKIYYELPDGSRGNEHWELRNGDWYYIGAGGNVIKDNVIVAYDDNYYVFDEKGRMLRSQTIFKNGLSYVIDAHGVAHPEETEEERLLQEYAKELAAGFTDNSMTTMEKCRAIYTHLPMDFTFDEVNETDMDIVASGIKAFDLKRGNCFVLMAKAHYLYQAIGVKDMLVICETPEGERKNHWWNLVKIEDKYYHMDVTPFDGAFHWNLMPTEAFLESGKDNNMIRYLHQYNIENYPKAY